MSLRSFDLFANWLCFAKKHVRIGRLLPKNPNVPCFSYFCLLYSVFCFLHLVRYILYPIDGFFSSEFRTNLRAVVVDNLHGDFARLWHTRHLNLYVPSVGSSHFSAKGTTSLKSKALSRSPLRVFGGLVCAFNSDCSS